MKAYALAAAVILAAPIGNAAPAQSPGPAVASASVDVAPFVAHQVHPKVHLLSTPEEWYAAAIGNVVLIEQSDGFVVVDSGFNAANGRAVVRYAKSLANKPIKAVLITHWHGDHPQGVSAIRDAFPKVRIISTRGTEAGLRGPASYDIGYRPDPKVRSRDCQSRRAEQGELPKVARRSRHGTRPQGTDQEGARPV